MNSIQALERVFKMGPVELPDPDPTAEPEAAIKVLAVNFPHLVHCTLSAPTVEGERCIYEVIKPPVKTNGNGAEQAVYEQLNQWAERAESVPLSAAEQRPFVLGDHACRHLLQLLTARANSRRLRPPLTVPQQWLPPL